MNLQQIYDKIVAAMISQQERCTNDFDDAVVRNSWDMVDPVGALISDEYDLCDANSHTFIRSYELQNAVQESLGITLEPEMINLITEAQIIHDCHDPMFWGTHFHKLATSYGLLPFKPSSTGDINEDSNP